MPALEPTHELSRAGVYGEFLRKTGFEAAGPRPARLLLRLRERERVKLLLQRLLLVQGDRELRIDPATACASKRQ